MATINTIQWTGNNLQEIDDFFSIEGKRIGGHGFVTDETMFVDTIIGKKFASKGDYIMKDWDNKFYVVKEETINRIFFSKI